MRIGIIGTGYVGLVHGAVLSSYGYQVTCMDVDVDKIKRLQAGISPIYEIGLEELLRQGLRDGMLTFTTSPQQVIQESDVIFIAVGTPAKEDGSADLSYVRDVVQHIATYIDGYKVIVCKSTMPVGTSRRIANYLDNVLTNRYADYSADVVSNPEFLRQGKAVTDALSPSRVIIGTESSQAKEILQSIYQVHIQHHVPFVYTNLESAEMIKYASNSFLAVKISFINELALVSEKVGASIQDIATGMGLDERISPHFLQAGPGYGGSCFPKDTQAMLDIGEKNGEDLYLIRAAVAANEKQKKSMLNKISESLSVNDTLRGKTISLWGLSFKPDTDDIRSAPSFDIIKGLLQQEAIVRVFCPQGMEQAKRLWSDLNERIIYCHSEADCAQDADAIVLMTEWNQFRSNNWPMIAKRMRGNAFFDLRNMFTTDVQVRELFQYYSVGSS